MIYPVSGDTLEMGGEENSSPLFDVVCLSHLRWDFVYQRPQYLLSRYAKQRRVFFVEEPIFVDGPAQLEVSQRDERLYVITPLLPKHLSLTKQVVERMQPQFARFISPTKTLEYMAGGKPIVSTSIRDVVSPYGEQGLVRIADTAAEFVAAI